MAMLVSGRVRVKEKNNLKPSTSVKFFANQTTLLLYVPGSINSLVLGDGRCLPPLMTGILIMGPYKPRSGLGLMTIPYYMEIMGVDRP